MRDRLRRRGPILGRHLARFGALGDGTTTDSDVPVQVQSLTGEHCVRESAIEPALVKTDGWDYPPTVHAKFWYPFISYPTTVWWAARDSNPEPTG